MTSESTESSRSASSTAGSTAGARSKGGERATPSKSTSVCTFWLGDRCFGIDTHLVGEVVTVEDSVRVPLAPAAVRGLFNLRGEPIPLVSLADLLTGAHGAALESKTALVLRSGDLVVGLAIDRVEAVIPPDRSGLTPPTSRDDDPMVLGFLETGARAAGGIVSILDPVALVARINQLRFLQSAGA